MRLSTWNLIGKISPNIYDALVIEETNLVLETQQQLGDGLLERCYGTTEGLKRGLKHETQKLLLVFQWVKLL